MKNYKHPTDLLLSEDYYRLIFFLCQLKVIQHDMLFIDHPIWDEENKKLWPHHYGDQH